MRSVLVIAAVMLLFTGAVRGQSTDEEIAKAVVAVELAKLSLNTPTPKPPAPVVPATSNGKPEYFGPRLGWMVQGVDGVYRSVVAPEVAAPPTFRPAIPYNASHQCPQCGRNQFEISGWGPVPGTHTHTCSAGHVWYH